MGVVLGFFYNPVKNLFIDGDGFIVYEIFRILSPGQLILFKKNKTDFCVRHKDNVIQLYWLTGDGISLDIIDETRIGESDDIERYENKRWYKIYL